MRFGYFLSFFIFISFNSFCQNRTIDSLNKLLKIDIEDTNKVNHLYKLGDEYRKIGSYNNVLTYCTPALELANKLDFKKGLSITYNIIGITYYQQGNHPKALDCYLKSLKLAEELGNKNEIMRPLGNIGIMYMEQKDYSKALEYYFKALQMAQQLKNKNRIGVYFANIGIAYKQQHNYIKALDYYFQALKITEEANDKNGIARNLGNIGGVYSAETDYNHALDYYFKALKIKQELKDVNEIARTISNIGEIYTQQKKYNKAKDYLYKALFLADSIGAIDIMQNEYVMLSNLYEKSTLPLTDSIRGNILNMEQMRLKSMNYYKRSIEIKDQLFNEENKKQLIQKEMTYEFDKKESLSKAAQEKKDAIASNEKKRQKLFLISVIAGLFIVMVFSLFIARSLRITTKQKHIIELQKRQTDEQKSIIEEKNKDITDSIKYASRIQRALLTSEDYLLKYIPNHFILYKPKDIVSGDFYWAFSSKDDKGKNRFYITCCDCTGHGVAGAFMSLLNISLLNEAVIEKKIYEPNEIFNFIRTNIVKALNPDGGDEIKDGMDAIICALDVDRKTLDVSCANNPLWLIREGKMIEIAPDKMPVGSYTNMDKSFSQHSIELRSGDIMYASTDGYADQFGGDRGKKFKYKQLQEILIANAHLSMEDQKAVLNKKIEDWKGSLEQVDDILIIGIKI